MNAAICIPLNRAVPLLARPAGCLRVVWFALGLGLAATVPRTHAAPVNDHFTNAIPLRSLIVTTFGNNLSATAEPGEPRYSGDTTINSVWYDWYCPASGTAVINTFGSTNAAGGQLDTVLTVYTGAALTNLSLIASNDDYGGNNSRLEFAATAGTVYHIAVDGWGNRQFNFTLNITGAVGTVSGFATLVPTGSVWRYYDEGFDPGASWAAPGFDDSSWSNGVAELGFGDAADGRPEATLIRRIGSNPANPFTIAFYFRRAFVVSNVSALASLSGRLLRDDGGVVWLNGAGVLTNNMAAGPIDYLTLANVVVGGTEETNWVTFTAPPGLLVEGTNVVAVEIHQQNTNSSDVSFDLELTGVLSASNTAPFATLLSPTNGAQFPAPTNITLSADAWDTNGAVTLVEFFSGTNKLGQDATHPYSFTWSNMATGSHPLTVVATDNSGAKATSSVVTVTIGFNPPPEVTLISPTNGQSFNVPIHLLLEATATDSNGVARVDFYAGTTRLYQAFASPYRYTWSNVIAGAYTLTAVAVDALGAAATSAPVNVTVTGNYPPTVALTNPTDGASFSAPASFALEATASDLDGTVTNVEFFEGSTSLGSDASAPFSLPWNGAVAGSYAFRAVATDNTGARATSAVVNVTLVPNTPPTVALISPTNGALYTIRDLVPLTATASDSGGSVTRVEFFAGNTLLGEATASPYSLTWSNPAAGAYSLTAVATDNGGLRATSAPVAITVTASAYGGLQFDGVDDYVTFGPAPGLGARAFTLETWFKWTGGGTSFSTGSGGVNAIPLLAKGRGEADGDNRDMNYFLGIRPADGVLAADFEEGADGANPGQNRPVTGVTPITLNEWHHAAATYDGTNWAIYLDGVLETNLFVGRPPRWDSIQHASLGRALDSTGTPQGAFAGVLDEVRVWNHARSAAEIAAFKNLAIPSAPGLIGHWSLDETNGLTAFDSSGNAHDGTLVNGPLWVVGQTLPWIPAVALTSPTNGATLETPGTVALSATASDYDGTVTKVEFFDGPTRLGMDTSSPYSLGWMNPPAGTHVLKAVATDNDGRTNVSLTVTVLVVNTIVQLTSPTNGARFVTPDPIPLAADASDANGTITLVEFFAGTSLIGQDASRPFTGSWSNAPVGSHVLTAVATDAGGIRNTSAPVNITVTANLPPTVSLTAPANGATLYAPTNVTLDATASDPDGAVARVEFYAGTTKLGEDTASPFSVVWTNAPLGTHALTAVATDDHGLAVTSAVVNVTVAVNPPPTVSLTSPVDGATFSEAVTISLSATANDTDGLSRVEFYRGVTKLGEDSTSPYDFAWPNVPAGVHQLTAVAVDLFGAAATSAPVNITVTNNAAPTVTLTSPTNNATFTGPTNILLAATATDDFGVARVEFFQGGLKLGEDTTAPYQYDWQGVSGGNYVLTAVATDTGGRLATSAPVNILVSGRTAGTNVFIVFGTPGSPGTVWKYHDRGVDLGTNWIVPAYDDSSWSNGPSQLGYSEPSLEGDEVTVLSYGPDPLQKYPTYYFRHAFVPPNATAYDYLNLRLLRDDGGVVYLNGREIYRSPNMPAGPISYTTYATSTGENTVDVVNGLPNSLVDGTNVIAVEIHQQAPSSSDVSFDLELAGVINNTAPLVFLTAPTNGATFDAPANVTLAATATDSDGSVTNVEFYVESTWIGQDGTAPYTAVWSNVIIGGAYALRAVATDNFGARGTSAVVTVNILGNFPPTVSITSPADYTTFLLPTNGQPTNVLIEATASDPEGSVSRVEFFRDTTKLGEDTSAPFVFNWTNSAAGNFTLTAVATDGAGLTATSAPVHVIFLSGSEPGTLVATGAVWRYLDDGSDQGTAWINLNFDDSSWSNGVAELGFGDAAEGRPEATLIRRYIEGTSTQVITYYFRHRFVVNNPSAYRSLQLQLKRDDGAVVYLNGVAVLTNNFPAGTTTINYQTLAANAQDDGANFWPFALSPALLVQGTNILAVEVHQGSTSSSDISFDLELTGSTTNAVPSVTLTSPPDGAVYNAPALIPLSATASDSDGSLLNVTFYANGTNALATLTTPPYSFTWQNMPLGAYALTAVALDNEGARATSSVATVYVLASSAPTVDSFVPTPGVVGSLTQITVNFSEPVDGVDASDLLINGVAATGLAISNTAYTFSFPQPAEGSVSVTWAYGHGIVDRENPPKPFDGTATNETARYTLVDTAAPLVMAVTPTPGATVRSLPRVEITFNEPVGGVDAGDLLMNGAPANKVSGSLAGPYVFNFDPPASGVVQLAWATNHAIHDLALTPNAFAGGAWTCTLDPASPETGVVINEIMYHPASELTTEEYVELFNTNAVPVNLTGWRLTGGVNYSLPAVTIPAGGFLVIAADVAAFRARYPSVPATNVVGGWVGRLSNRSDRLRLRNALGDVVQSVNYATEGDWAIRQRGPLDSGSRGWEWFAAHDGNVINTATGANEGNRSLELVNPALPHDNGQNWAASVPSGGTPGQPNSTAATDIAPLIYNVTHSPAVPRSTNVVTISARFVDELATGLTARVYYRDVTTTTPGPWANTNLFDDGAHGDGLANDLTFAAQLPARPNRTVIEFYVSVTDATGHTRTWPAAARLETGAFSQAANALYQVDDENYTGNKPFFRLVATAAETNEFHTMSSASDAEMNATLITSDGVDTKVRYNCSFRHRGAGTRGVYPYNMRVNVPTDRTWNGLTEFNLNTRYVHAQVVGAHFSLRAGMPCAQARPVQVRLNGYNHAQAGAPQFGHYVFLEAIGGEWAAIHFPDDPNGNAYRGSRYPWTANLSYRGTDPNVYLAEGYSKTSNQGENDWTDLINLTYALNDTNSPGYVQGVQRHANVRMFMRYFAVCTAADYMETSMCRGVGDDYAMYRGVNDPRFLLIPHDFDTTFGQGDSPGIQNPNNTIWPMLNPPTSDPTQRANYLARFMRDPEFAPLYYEELKRVADTVMAPDVFNPMVDRLLGDWVPAATNTAMKNFNATRLAYIRSQIPLTLSVSNNLPTQNGYLYTTVPNVTLWGRANAIETRSVWVAGSLAQWSAFSAAWTNTIALQPGLNTVVVQARNAAGLEFERATLTIWYNDGTTTDVSGTLGSDTVWTAAAGPYNVTANLTVPAGVTLIIEPGTTVYLGSGVNLIVANGGRLLAEGTALAPIRFTRAPGSTTSWGGITINGGVGSPESRIAYAHLEFNGTTAIHSQGGTVWLDHLSFGTTTQPYVAVDSSSFVISDCHFPTPTASFEPVHGTGGIKSGGRGIFRRNFFGAPTGYNDVVDFTGGHRPGPIVQFINNVFVGSGDDLLDLDNTDAWVEGNIFLHAHKNGSPDTSSAISGGNDTGQPSAITIRGNLIYDCDHAALAKQGNFYTFLNNTIVRQTVQGGTDTAGAVLVLADNGMSEGAGAYFEGNIIRDAEALLQNRTNALVTFTNNFLSLPWTGPGGGNSTNDPQFTYIPQVAETYFTNWQQAQVMWQWFALRPGSPAVGAGPNGSDAGGVVPLGASISGEPLGGATRETTATLIVGDRRTGNGIPVSGWPDGAGYTHYRWRLDGGAWSAETPVDTPISLSGLANGPHTVEVAGRRDAGLYQDDAAYGADAVLTRSRTWVVNTNAPAVRLNEILARNNAAVPVGSRYPDLIELFNASAEGVDLSGMGLTDDPSDPMQFTFPPGSYLGAGKFLVVYADNETTPPGHHTGFGLNQEGDALYLFGADGRLLDAVRFGPQLADLSIGRLADGTWALTQPTFGQTNRLQPTGDPRALRLNEWMAVGVLPAGADFLELFNSSPEPVELSGLFLTDTPQSLQALHPIAPLSFIGGGGFAVFIPDANPGAGPAHLGFRLAAEQGWIGLLDTDLSLIDCVFYGGQSNNVAFGRSPNGSTNFTFLPLATPGAPNPSPSAPIGTQLLINEVLAKNVNGLTNPAGATPAWIELYNPTTNTIVLTDMSLTDNLALPRKYVFPAGMSLAPGQYLFLWCDGSLPASTNNTGFGLKANGDDLHLFDTLANGGGLLDSVTYGVQAKDFSIGRVASLGNAWTITIPTPQAVNIPAPTGDPWQLRVNEWMAAPSSGDDWFEIYNPNPQPVALAGLWLTDDTRTLASRMRFPIPPLSFIGTGLYGYEKFTANGVAGGTDEVNFKLERNGEWLGISAPDGTLIHGLRFEAQATGVSEGALPDGSTNIVRFPTTPTPADANYLPLTNVVVNEVLSGSPTNSGLEDAIELHNVSPAPVDITGWFLSDALRTLNKFRITNQTVLPPGGFVVFYESQFNANPDDPNSFSLDATKGDEVYLSAATNGTLTGYRAVAEFGATEPGVSFGRFTNRVGTVDFTALSQLTFGTNETFTLNTGAPNAYPKIGPVVITEIMYHPPDFPGALDNVRDEFIELLNVTTNPVPLFDPAFPTNVWKLRDAVDFDFPTNVTLGPGGVVLVVSFDPTTDTNSLAAFRAAYNLGTNIALFGPYSGKLDNSGENVELYKPGQPVPAGLPDAGYVPKILVDRVKYADLPPWDPLADGYGWSLQRLDPYEYGNDPLNWRAAAPTPGPQQTNPDTDSDGMPDDWENTYGFNPNDPFDANQDADGDGLTNLQEYRAGTSPRDPASVLKLETVNTLGAEPATNVVLRFDGVAGKSYTIEFTDTLPAGWQPLQHIDPLPASGIVWLTNGVPPATVQRFYRIFTPRAP